MAGGDAMSSTHTDPIARLAAAEIEIENLRMAICHRTVIGQAEGILMVRLSIDADTAFAYLRRVSMSSNRKLVDLAEDVVRTRELPGTN